MSQRRLPQEPELTPFEAGFPPGNRWLFLGAHPDDETFGPGATLAIGRDRGVTITTVVVTDGRIQGDPAERAGELARATGVLGLEPPRLWQLPDRTLDPLDRGLLGRLDEVLRAERPDLVLVPAPVDLNIDHRALALAVWRVIRRRSWLGLQPGPVRWVAAYEVASPLLPNLLVAADAAWARKRAAAECYTGQEAYRPYLRVMEALGELRRLTLKGCERAEALHVLPARRLARLRPASWAALMGSPRMVMSVRDGDASP